MSLQFITKPRSRWEDVPSFPIVLRAAYTATVTDYYTRQDRQIFYIQARASRVWRTTPEPGIVTLLDITCQVGTITDIGFPSHWKPLKRYQYVPENRLEELITHEVIKFIL